MMTHHCYDVIITQQNLKFDKFADFSCDIEYNSRTDVFRDVISLIINHCDPRRSNGASGGHKVSPSRVAQASEARMLFRKAVEIISFFCRSVNISLTGCLKIIAGL